MAASPDLRCFGNDKTRRLLYNCSSAKSGTNSSTTKEIGLPLQAIIYIQNKLTPFLCHPSVLDSRKFVTCFLSHLFYFQVGIVRI